MDRDVTVRFFRIIGGKRTRVPFSSRLSIIAGLDQATATRKIEDIPFWNDKIITDGSYISGRFCRKQSSNLPPKAPITGGLEPLGVASVGRTAAWSYNLKTSLLAMEFGRDGLTLSRFITYVNYVTGSSGYSFLPVTTEGSLDALQRDRIRSLSIQVATPSQLQATLPNQIAVKTGFESIMTEGLSTRIDVTYSLSTGDQDMKKGPVTNLVKWLRGEKASDRGSVTRLQARVIDANGDSRSLELLDDVQLLCQSELPLPDDEPEKNYELRRAFVRSCFLTHKDVIEKQFGPLV